MYAYSFDNVFSGTNRCFSCQTCAKELVRVPPNERDRITQVQKTMIEQFWGDDGVQLCFTQRAAELWSGLKTMK